MIDPTDAGGRPDASACAGTLKVAVVTPYFEESTAILERCHQSVRAQTYPATHYMVADGRPNPAVDGWQVQHLVLPQSQGDYGDTPRGLGALLAASSGVDAIAFLDADNWYRPEHLEQLVQLQRQTGAAVCTATRSLHRLDGSLMGVDLESDGRRHVDTNCLFLMRSLFRVLPLWLTKPRELSPQDDRVIWQAIVARQPVSAHCEQATVAYSTRHRAHYVARGEQPPANAIDLATEVDTEGWWYRQDASFRQDWLRYFATGVWR
jgi:glycosyltransferase involved in cell wall biosynthesis